MRHLIALSLILIACAARPAGAKRLDASVDVCSLRPDLCDDQTDQVDQAPARSRRPARSRGLDAETLSLASVNRAAPARARRAPAAAARRPARSITCRPATIEVTEANADLPECGQRGGRGPAAVDARQVAMSFSSYMNQNAANPALNRKSIANYQTAFADTAKPATLDVTGLVDGSGVRENTAAAPTATSRNNQ